MHTCKLCLQEKDLCKSHIFPEFMYKKCYEEDHSFVQFTADESQYNKKRRKGIYEKLLCRDCEDVVKVYEDYAKKILYEMAQPYIYEHKKPYSLKIYDYKIFKLFVLSLVWRASVSSQDTFELIKLGPYEEEIRLILKEGRETEVDNYPALIYQTFIGETPSDGVFLQPYYGKSKHNGRTIVQFVADGFFFAVGIGKCSIKNFPGGCSVGPEMLRIGKDELGNLKKMVDVFVRIHQLGRFSHFENKHDK